MTIISSLLLFFLCLSFHACNARRLVATGKEPEEKFHLSTKNDEKASRVEITSVPRKVSNKFGADSMLKESRVVDEADHKPIGSKADQEELKDQRAASLDLVSVSWSGEQQPGFNLDYSPPKTHPPVHN